MEMKQFDNDELRMQLVKITTLLLNETYLNSDEASLIFWLNGRILGSDSDSSKQVFFRFTNTGLRLEISGDFMGEEWDYTSSITIIFNEAKHKVIFKEEYIESNLIHQFIILLKEIFKN